MKQYTETDVIAYLLSCGVLNRDYTNTPDHLHFNPMIYHFDDDDDLREAARNLGYLSDFCVMLSTHKKYYALSKKGMDIITPFFEL